jgi:hypothetical protein
VPRTESPRNAPSPKLREKPSDSFMKTLLTKRTSKNFESLFEITSKGKDKFYKETLENLFLENPDLSAGICKFMKKNSGNKKAIDYEVFEASCIHFIHKN